MNMMMLDWMMILIPIIVIIFISAHTRKYIRSVADFMAGGRVAGRYIISVSDGIAAMGLITVVGQFEFVYQSGFAVGYWYNLQVPVMMFVALSGYIVYRFRETRAMTMAQFFEIRYSRKFRVFTGFLGWLAGVINYGIFPAVGGRFFMYYFGLPTHFSVLGFQCSTFAVLMLVFLFVALLLVLLGGQLTIMVSDCIQGIFGYVMYLVIAIAIFKLFSWSEMSTSLLDRPPGKSLLNPFDTMQLQDFNIWYVLISIIGSVYIFMAWQGNQGYNCAARTPHEAKMGRILGTWRGGALFVMLSLLSVAAYTYLHHPAYSVGSAAVNASLAQIDNPAIQTQMRVPVALAHLLPTGVTGAFAAVMLFLMVSTDTTYIHSWGGIFIQDIIVPLRKQPLEPEQHVRMLRASMICVAIFAFLFSFFFKQNDYILMFFALTGTIYLGGAGAAIVGGLYWKKGTTQGAWCAMVVGALMGLGGFILQHNWTVIHGLICQWFPDWHFMVDHAEKFPINSQWWWLFAIILAVSSYVIISLLTCRENYNMDRMLHRGIYAHGEKEKKGEAIVKKPPRSLKNYLGIDKEFTRGDKIISYSVFGWSMGLFAIWLVITVMNLIPALRWSDKAWAQYFWIMGVVFPFAVGIITSVWFTIGGVSDLRKLFRDLKVIERNDLDDGRVVDNMNLQDVAFDRAVEDEMQQNNEP